MEDIDAAAHNPHSLRRSGALIAIDDFGTGYSSLSYLKSLPLDKIKIDKSVQDIGQDEGATIVRAIIQLGKSLGMTVIAEGVETLRKEAYLIAEGCQKARATTTASPAGAGSRPAAARQSAPLRSSGQLRAALVARPLGMLRPSAGQRQRLAPHSAPFWPIAADDEPPMKRFVLLDTAAIPPGAFVSVRIWRRFRHQDPGWQRQPADEHSHARLGRRAGGNPLQTDRQPSAGSSTDRRAGDGLYLASPCASWARTPRYWSPSWCPGSSNGTAARSARSPAIRCAMPAPGY